MATASSRYTEALANQYRAALRAKNKSQRGPDYSVLSGDSSVATSSPIKAPAEKLTGVRKILDILSQPLYSTVETAKDTAADVVRGINTGNPGDIAGGILKAAPRLLGNLGNDNDKKSWSDVLRGDVDFINSFNEQAGIDKRVTEETGILANPETEAGQHVSNRAGKFAVGLIADIIGDPTSYVGPGLIKGAVKLPVELAGRTTVGAAGINAVKSSKIGQDAIKFGERLHGLKTLDEAEDVGVVKAETELNRIEAAKAEAAGIPEALPTPDIPPTLSAPNTTAKELPFGPDIQPNEGMLLGKPLAAAPEPPPLSATGFGVTEEMGQRTDRIGHMLLSPEGELKKYTTAGGRQMDRGPLYDESAIQRLRDKPPVKRIELTPVQKAEADAEEILAKQEVKTPASVSETDQKSLRAGFGDYVRKQIAAGDEKAIAFHKAFAARKAGTSTKLQRDLLPLLRQTLEENFLETMPRRGAVRPAERLASALAPIEPLPGLSAGEGQPAVKLAASSARAARARQASTRRLGGAALTSWINATKASGISQEHIAELLAAKNVTEYGRVVGKLARAKGEGTPRNLDFTVSLYRHGGEIAHTANMKEEVLRQTLESPVAQAIQNVEPVSSIMARLNPDPDPAAIAQIAAGNNMAPEVLQGVKEVLVKQGWLGKTEELPFTSNTGTLRSEPVLGEGVGRNVAYNAPMQMEIFSKILELRKAEISAIRATEKTRSTSRSSIGQSGTHWKYRASEQIYDLIKQDLQAVDDFMFANGVAGVASAGKSGPPLYLSQMLDALMASDKGQRFALGRIFDSFGYQINRVTGGRGGSFRSAKTAGREGTADIDSLMKLVAKIARLAETPDAAGIAKFNQQFDGFTQDFVDTLRGKHVGPQGESVREIGTLTKGDEGYVRKTVAPEQAAHVLKDAREAFTDPVVLGRLFQHMNENAAKSMVQFASETQSVAQDTVQHVLQVLDDATGLTNDAQRVESLLHPQRIAKEFTQSSEVADIAADAARARISEVVPEVDITSAQHSESAFKHGDTAQNMKNSNKANATNYNAMVSASLVETAPEALLSTDTVTDIAMQTGIFKMLDSFARRFVAHYGNATVHEAITAMGSVGGVLSRAYARDLTKADTLAKQIAASRGLAPGAHREVAKEAWDVIRKGNYDEAGPEISGLVGQLRHLSDAMFATPKPDGEAQSVLSQFFREGFDVDHINEKLSQGRFGFGEDIRISKTAPAGKGKARAATVQEMSDQWRTWDIADPIDFLHRMERVTSEISTEVGISREFYRLATARGLASTKPRPGFIGVTRASLSPESIVRYLPKSDRGITYIHKDLIPEIKRMDSLLDKVNTNNPELRSWLRNNLDPILAMWKSGMTIWRPGHHFRNVVGDTGMAFLVSGVKNPVYYAKAVKMITQKQNALGRTLRGEYGTWDAMAAMQGLHRAAEGGAFNKELTDEILKLGGDAPAGTIARGRVANKPYEVDSTELFRALMDRGVLPDFRHQEDIIDIGTDSKALNKRIANKIGFEGSGAQKALDTAHNKLANFTEARDDFIRLAHAMHLIENGIDGKKTWKTAEEMYDAIAARIRKTHPDGTDLTPFEKNVMRRVFPFYSWTRKAIPLVFENTLTHPGRFLVYPKAMYNFGEASGVDLESLSDPFPDDQVFPHFITDKMTGIGWESADGHYWSFDSGIPQADVLNDFIGNGSAKSITGGIAGMLNPALKLPIELGTGTQLDGQLPITDSSDYIDAQIPGLNSINSIFGISPTSAVENLTEGRLGLDPSRQAERGNRGGITENPEYALNYLFGQRLLDTSKPNYINLGRIQQIDAMNKLKEQSASN